MVRKAALIAGLLYSFPAAAQTTTCAQTGPFTTCNTIGMPPPPAPVYIAPRLRSISGDDAKPVSMDISDGNKFLAACRQDNGHLNATDIGLCYGYIRGYVDRDIMESADRLACYPANVTQGQILDVILRFIENDPKNRHLPTLWLSGQAVHNAWPCPK